MKLDRNKYLESRSLKPITLFLAVLSVNLVLALIVWVFPVDGISFAKGQNLKFISWTELKGETKPQKTVDIEEVISNVSPKGALKPTAFSSTDTKNTDSLSSKIVAEIASSVNFDTSHQKLITPISRSILLPPNNPTVLATLIKALTSESKTKVVRILFSIIFLLLIRRAFSLDDRFIIWCQQSIVDS